MKRLLARVLALPVLLAAGATVLTAPAASALSGEELFPVLNCVRDVDATHYQAVFAGHNYGSTTVDVPIGPTNKTWPGSEVEGQPVSFPVGATVFEQILEKTATAKWRLGGRVASAAWAVDVPRCDDPGAEVRAPDLVGVLGSVPTVGSTATMVGERVPESQQGYDVSFAWRTGCQAGGTPSVVGTGRSLALGSSMSGSHLQGSVTYADPGSADARTLTTPCTKVYDVTAPTAAAATTECVSAPLSGQLWAAHFRVVNAGDPVVIPVGTNNFFAELPSLRGQPTSFPTGVSEWSTTFTDEPGVGYTADSSATWMLGRRLPARADVTSPRCERIDEEPSLHGVPVVGASITMSGEQVSLPDRPYTVSYEWFRDCETAEPVSVGDERSYTVQPDDDGHRLQGVITYARGTTGIRVSTPCDAAATAGRSPASEVAPAITGTPKVDEELSLSGGSWTGSIPTTESVTWQVCDEGTCETAGTGATYTPVAGDVGRSVRAVVTASNVYGSGSVTTAAVGPVRSDATPRGSLGPTAVTFGPTVVGAERERFVVYVNDSGEPLELSAIDLTGAAAADFEVVGGGCEVGDPIANGESCAIEVRFAPGTSGIREASLEVDDGSTHVVALSGSAGVAPSASSGPVVVGDPVAGQPLSVSPGTWAGTGTIGTAVRWETCTQSGCSPAGSGATWTPTVADVGHSVRAVVTATNDFGSISVATPAAGPVAAPVTPSAAAALTLNVTRLDLGKAKVRKLGKARAVLISNGGGTPLVVHRIAVSGKHRKDVVVSTTCPGDTLAPGASCRVTLQLRPAAAGRRTATLVVTSTAPGDPGRVALTGRGIKRR